MMIVLLGNQEGRLLEPQGIHIRSTCFLFFQEATMSDGLEIPPEPCLNPHGSFLGISEKW